MGELFRLGMSCGEQWWLPGLMPRLWTPTSSSFCTVARFCSGWLATSPWTLACRCCSLGRQAGIARFGGGQQTGTSSRPARRFFGCASGGCLPLDHHYGCLVHDLGHGALCISSAQHVVRVSSWSCGSCWCPLVECHRGLPCFQPSIVSAGICSFITCLFG